MVIGATAGYTYAFRGTGISLQDYVDSLESLGRMGIRSFDLEVLQAQHLDLYATEENLARLHQACADSGVEIVGFTAWACLELLHSLRAQDEQACLNLFDRLAGLASRLGARYIHLGSDMIAAFIVERDPTYVTAPATRVSIPPDVDLRDVMMMYARRVGALAEIAGRHGLKFALEPRANALVHNADGFLRLVEHADHANLYCCLDIVHFAWHREDVPMVIETLGDRLLVVQLCDCIPGEMVHLPLGEGEVPLEPILAALRKVGFDGFLMLEIYRGGDDPKDVVDCWYESAFRTVSDRLQ